ncbi:MAG: 2-(1,2-epoxy-1,2-dihydrophenyl)acetyl-CoA isomerase [Sphingomonas sp. SCN 67-18]|uniref:enoyl-CoA hydratase-related protein n=1 Tax=uncultured Sphingomonas sp. TaxID=158754 RepID=UPI00086BB1F7|nr:enoyl-CoA hydratase-related protein [Sphingomonas sp. SCN 67-18]ODU20181.1 MAG: 2-(1,2-epoxy-1,2-dihydrophenyl)acetyl-CoA isomerase [Sphingomonas sp. SCN 67-18]
MTYDHILFDVADSIATITLNRPDRLNAAPPVMFDEIADALDNLGGARAVLITGAGRAFCAGADLAGRDASQSVSGGAGAYRALTRTFNPTLLKIAALDVPVVTAVNGAAAGIGCSLALAGDFAIAGRSAYFLQAFVNIGLVPDGGASWMLTRLVGKARAMQMVMLGERIHADQAEQWGLIYKAVDDDALAGEARALAARLAAGPTVALGLMRRGLVAAMESDYASALAAEAADQRSAGNSADAVEGALSFLQKRKPAFKGA